MNGAEERDDDSAEAKLDWLEHRQPLVRRLVVDHEGVHDGRRCRVAVPQVPAKVDGRQ